MTAEIAKFAVRTSGPELRNNAVNPIAQEVLSNFRDIHSRIRYRIFLVQRPTLNQEEIADIISQLDEFTIEESNQSTDVNYTLLPEALGFLRKSTLVISDFVRLIAEIIDQETTTEKEKDEKFKRILNNPKTAESIALLGYASGATADETLNHLKILDKFDPKYFQIINDTLMLNQAGIESIQKTKVNATTYIGCPARHVRSTTSDFANHMFEKANWEISLYARLWKPLWGELIHRQLARTKKI